MPRDVIAITIRLIADLIRKSHPINSDLMVRSPAKLKLRRASRTMARGAELAAILRDACLRQGEDKLLRPYVLPVQRRLTPDASARVTRIGRAEPHARRMSHG